MMQNKNTTVIYNCFWSVVLSAALLCAAAIICVLISLAEMFLYGERHGLNLLMNSVRQDSLYMAKNNLQGFNFLPNPTDIINYLESVVSSHFQQNILNTFAPFIIAVLLSAKLFMLRSCLLLHDASLFFILAAVCFTDGLAQRYIRKKSAGRESAFIYYNLKPFITLVLAVAVIVQLDSPFSVKITEWIVMCAVIVSALILQTVIKRYKKHL